MASAAGSADQKAAAEGAAGRRTSAWNGHRTAATAPCPVSRCTSARTVSPSGSDVSTGHASTVAFTRTPAAPTTTASGSHCRATPRAPWEARLRRLSATPIRCRRSVIRTTHIPAISVQPPDRDPGRMINVAMALPKRMAICDCHSLYRTS